MGRRFSALGFALCALLGRAPSALATPASAFWSSPLLLDHDSDKRSDAFGRTVAVSGNLAVVSDSTQIVGAFVDVGQVYTYARSGGAWLRQGSALILPGGKPEDFFGYCVALSGNTLLASVFSHTGEAMPVPGSVYAFSYTPAGWQQQGPKLVAQDGYPSDAFGTALAVSGDTAVISAPGSNDAYKVYVFVNEGGTWRQQGPALSHPGGAKGRYFGTSVAISGDTLLVGAAAYAEPATVGAAFVFVRAAGKWTQQGPPLSSGVEQDQYGYAVALNGDTAVVGAPQANGTDGAAYIYERNAAGVWTQQGPALSGPSAQAGAFGGTVSVWGNQAVIAAPALDAGKGALLLYGRTANVWVQAGGTQYVVPDGAAYSNSNVGQALAMAGPNVFVGLQSDFGAAYALRACATGNCCAADSECSTEQYCSAAGSCEIRRATADPCDCFEPGCHVCVANDCGQCSTTAAASAAGAAGAGVFIEGGAAGDAGAPSSMPSAGAPAGGSANTGGVAGGGAAADATCASGGACSAPVPDSSIASCGCRVGGSAKNRAPLTLLLGLWFARRRRLASKGRQAAT